jgi:hypothetical protein
VKKRVRVYYSLLVAVEPRLRLLPEERAECSMIKDIDEARQAYSSVFLLYSSSLILSLSDIP